MTRRGWRKNFRVRIKENNEVLKALGAKPLSFKAVHAEYQAAGKFLKPFVANTVVLLHKAMRRRRDILFEGAQGTFLDIDHGTYPFVTSSNTTAGGACTGSGVPPHRMDRVVGVMKAYTTRVGEGPLPTENAEIADMLHGMGREFGATTGRARRCGWFDSVATRHAAMVNGIDDLAITNLDGLDTVETIKVCVAYRDGKAALRLRAERRASAGRLRAGLCRISGLAHADGQGAQVETIAAKGAGVSEGDCRIERSEIEHRLRRPGPRADDFCLITNLCQAMRYWRTSAWIV